MAMDAAPSQTPEPVSWRSPSPAAASTSPTMAALSSNRAALTVVSALLRRWASRPRCSPAACWRDCDSARTKDAPSASPATTSTT